MKRNENQKSSLPSPENTARNKNNSNTSLTVCELRSPRDANSVAPPKLEAFFARFEENFALQWRQDEKANYVIMYLMYYLDDAGKRVYTMNKIDPKGMPTFSAHPARFSPEDKYSRQRVTLKKRFGILMTQQASTVCGQ